jgi:hypothetical protein
MRTYGKTKRKLEVDIERDLQEIICEAMNSAGSARIQWRIPENMVITVFRFHKERRRSSQQNDYKLLKWGSAPKSYLYKTIIRNTFLKCCAFDYTKRRSR